MKRIALHQKDDYEALIVPDADGFSSCQQCILERPYCDEICRKEGYRYHVSELKTYNRLHALIRRIKRLLLNHY